MGSDPIKRPSLGESMRRIRFAALSLVALAATSLAPRAAAPTATLTLRNPIAVARPSETVVVQAAELRKVLGVEDVRAIRVRDEATGRDLLTQAVDLDDNGSWDELLFQLDLEPTQTRTLTLTPAERRIPRRDDYKVYGRFVRERRDDFAWENDRVAHRMYGAALETWVQEPLTSSGVDAWVKRTPRLIINDWYLVDDYHRDTGDGADLYSVGRTRGCGGSAPWVNGRLAASPNFRGSRVIANGPLRVMFELTYEPWDANGLTISEVKRVTLDAGHQLNRFESRYTVHAAPRELAYGVGIRKNPGSEMALGRETGVLRTWEPLKDAGHLGCAAIVDPAAITETLETDGNYAIVNKVPASLVVAYDAGSAWDRGGHIADVAAWDRYLAEAAQKSRNPIEVRLSMKVPE